MFNPLFQFTFKNHSKMTPHWPDYIIPYFLQSTIYYNSEKALNTKIAIWRKTKFGRIDSWFDWIQIWINFFLFFYIIKKKFVVGKRMGICVGWHKWNLCCFSYILSLFSLFFSLLSKWNWKQKKKKVLLNQNTVKHRYKIPLFFLSNNTF